MRDSIHQGEVDIRYIVKKATNPSDVLVVAFPGAFGRLTGTNEVGYSNLMTIGRFNVNALFIRLAQEEVDLGFPKSRFTCINRDFKIERTVLGLINKIKAETGSQRIIATGSSMGGWCALYYGLKYDYDIICGSAPYLFRKHEPTIQYTAGGVTDDDKAWCDRLIRDAVANAGKSGFDKSVFFAWGKGEPLWKSKDQGPLALADLDAAGIGYSHKLYDYQDHDSVATLFPNILSPRLEICLGLKNEMDVEQTAEMRVNTLVKDKFASLVPLFDSLHSVEPNLEIRERVQYGGDDPERVARLYAAAAKGRVWFPGEKAAIVGKAGGGFAFWSALPANKLAYALSYSFQQSVLNHYKYNGDVTALRWVGNNIQYLLTVLRHLRAIPEYLLSDDAAKHIKPVLGHRVRAIQRLHCLLDYHCCLAENPRHGAYADSHEIRDEIIWSMQFVCGPIPYVHEGESNYDRLATLLHLALYFRADQTFFDAAYKTALGLLNELTDYYFDKNGVCRLQQAKMQHALHLRLRKIIAFIDANEFAEVIELKKLRRKYTTLALATSYLVAPDGTYPALGHSGHGNASTVPRAVGNFIKKDSNLAILGSDLAYITINSGTDIHAALKHCDLLAFQFFYDGEWLILDSGGGHGDLADFAQSSVAHSALLCDEKDYVAPNYSDWTCIDRFSEDDGYVSVSLSHNLFEDVLLTRKLVWLKPNVIVLYDVAVSGSSHLYTQNFILPSCDVNGDAEKVTTRIGGVNLSIQQFSNADLAQYTGTTDAAAEVEGLRGSLIRNFRKLEQGRNLAYTRKADSAEFLTVLEAHSGRPDEVAVRDARMANGVLELVLESGEKTSIDLNAEKEVFQY